MGLKRSRDSLSVSLWGPLTFFEAGFDDQLLSHKSEACGKVTVVYRDKVLLLMHHPAVQNRLLLWKATLQKVSKAESPLTQFLLTHIFQKAVCLGVTKPPKILQQADTHHYLELCLQGTTHPLVNGSLVPFMLANVAQQLFVEPTFESA